MQDYSEIQTKISQKDPLNCLSDKVEGFTIYTTVASLCIVRKTKLEQKFKQIWQCAKTWLGPDQPTMKTTTSVFEKIKTKKLFGPD